MVTGVQCVVMDGQREKLLQCAIDSGKIIVEYTAMPPNHRLPYYNYYYADSVNNYNGNTFKSAVSIYINVTFHAR